MNAPKNRRAVRLCSRLDGYEALNTIQFSLTPVLACQLYAFGSAINQLDHYDVQLRLDSVKTLLVVSADKVLVGWLRQPPEPGRWSVGKQAKYKNVNCLPTYIIAANAGFRFVVEMEPGKEALTPSMRWTALLQFLAGRPMLFD